jgi:hypothetical protein
LDDQEVMVVRDVRPCRGRNLLDYLPPRLVGFLRKSEYPSAAEPNYENACYENDDGHENIVEIHLSPRILCSMLHTPSTTNVGAPNAAVSRPCNGGDWWSQYDDSTPRLTWLDIGA